jgi:hypothetical protein
MIYSLTHTHTHTHTHTTSLWQFLWDLSDFVYFVSAHIMLLAVACLDFPTVGTVFWRSCRWGETSLWSVATKGAAVRPPDDGVWRATVEWYWQRKREGLRRKPVPVPLCRPQIACGLTRLSHDTSQPDVTLYKFALKHPEIVSAS